MTVFSTTAGKLQTTTADWLENRRRKTELRVQDVDIYRQRMRCSDSVRFDTNTQDWTGGMGMSPSGRFQVVEQAQPKRRAFSREGIRWDAAWIAIAAVIAVCVVILLADLAGMGLGSRSISRLDSKIQDLTRRNNEMRQQLELSAADLSVCTEALKLNLISGFGAPTVTLTAPQEMSAGAVTADVRGASAGWTTGDAMP